MARRLHIEGILPRCQWRSLAAALLLGSIVLTGRLPAQAKPARRVLILNEVDETYPLINLVDQGLRSALEGSPYRIEFYRESLDTVLFPDPDDQNRFRDFYLRKYQDRQPDVIITVGSSPLAFMIETHARAFPGVPIVFCFPNTPSAGNLTLDQDFTGVLGEFQPAETLAAALRLLPHTRHVVVVGGVAPFDRRQQAVIREQLAQFEKHLDISYLTDLPAPSLEERLRHLPPDTVVLESALGKDTAGTTFSSNESGPLVVNASNAPVFSLSDRHMGHGEVGGKISRASEQGRLAGILALRLLNGEKPRDVPPLRESAAYVFDSRALKRWGLSENDLPHGSIVLYRQPGFWEQYRKYVFAGILVFLIQAAAIIGLLWQRAWITKTEVQLRRSEEAFAKCFRRSPLAIVIARIRDGRYVEVNHTFEEQTGWTRDEVIGASTQSVDLWVDPALTSQLVEQFLANGSLRDCEVPFRRRDGEIRMALGSAEMIEVDGEPCGLVVVADITERKLAEEVLSSMSRRLIEAQDQERTRIARELHDDISQRIALLTIALHSLAHDLPASEQPAKSRLRDVCERVLDIEKDIRALSHRLHSSRLEYLGLEAACAGFCRELSDQQNVTIRFESDGIPEELPGEVSLCLFRVLQEALHNAVKHSGVSEFEVSLQRARDGIRLTVHDAGVGFDPKLASSERGIGLVSMAERMKLVGGELSIRSSPDHGTTLIARVPATLQNTA